jgi:ribosome biogenesis GTPase
MQLTDWGWNDELQQQFQSFQSRSATPALGHEAPSAPRGLPLSPARIAREDREAYLICTTAGLRLARVTGRLRHNAQSRADFPAVGDWVIADLPPGDGPAAIHAILPRRSLFARKAAGDNADQQVLAANIDTVFLVSGLDHDFNPRRIERYPTLAWESGAAPVIVLNKADVCTDLPARLADVETVAFAVPIHAVSAQDGRGVADLLVYLKPGATAALLGSSGVGKSSLINALLGEDRLRTAAVRADDSHGRHTTTHRELLLLPAGGVIIDTPGLRELQLWATDDALAGAFADIESLAADCRFRDCAHDTEPGCAIRAALSSGRLDAARYASYVKLKRELAYLARRDDVVAQAAEKERWKKLHLEGQKRMKAKRRW